MAYEYPYTILVDGERYLGAADYDTALQSARFLATLRRNHRGFYRNGNEAVIVETATGRNVWSIKLD